MAEVKWFDIENSVYSDLIKSIRWLLLIRKSIHAVDNTILIPWVMQRTKLLELQLKMTMVSGVLLYLLSS